MSPTTGPRPPCQPRPNEITSVGPLCPRYRRLTSDIAARPTNVIDSIAFLTPAALRTAAAASFTRGPDTRSRRTLEDMSIASARGGDFTFSDAGQLYQTPASSAYALLISRTSRWRTTSASVR